MLHVKFENCRCSSFCLACEAEARHMYCFSGGVVVGANMMQTSGRVKVNPMFNFIEDV